jgi:hypothetical protein
LHSIDWEYDYSNPHFTIHKGRDYYAFTVSSDKPEEVFEAIEISEADPNIVDQMKVLKAAKRGLKSKHNNNQAKKHRLCKKKSIKSSISTPFNFRREELLNKVSC